MKTRASIAQLSRAAEAFLVAAMASMFTSPVQAAPDCSMALELADWGENPTGDISIAPGQSCQFPIKIRGTVISSEIQQKPAYGKLKKLGVASYEYKAKAKYKGSDTFAIKATGEGPEASGTSVITVRATIE